MSPLDIRALLILKSVSSADIARSLGISRTLVSNTIHGHRETPVIRRAIADAIGCSYRECWGVGDPGIDRLRPGRKSVTPVTDSTLRDVA